MEFADELPGGHYYVADVPMWWVWVWYAGLLLAAAGPAFRHRLRWVALGCAGWLCVGLVGCAAWLPSDELRCTFLAVGHGGCTVIETPDGRVLLYDAGAMTGPDVTRRHIAPFLWSRGIRRIDEVFLSHADLDHFNGMPALLERFAVGQVTTTPSFAGKESEGVDFTLDSMEKKRIPVRRVWEGHQFSAGEITIDVLHPLRVSPKGNENSRSLVLLVRHAGHSLLLTGDLEGSGLERVLSLPPVTADVLMAPHHGSRTANTPALAQWARPKVVVSCEGPPRSPGGKDNPYQALGADYYSTHAHGAVTVRSHTTGFVLETFVTGDRKVIRR